jgi:23S rRNA (adenine2503-C2)-methyltransferase
MKRNIRGLDLEGIKTFFAENGDKAFRAKQVYEWLWKKSATDFESMTNLSKETRTLLEENFVINAVKIDKLQKSKDGTIKSAFKLHDNYIVEGVLIPTPKRMTACISSQVGCSLTCQFCATAKLKLERNIGADEIYDQVVLIMKQAEKHHNKPLTNIVYMGMGEPLLNYKNVVESANKITSPEGLGMSPSRITVSTAGVAKMIHKLGDDQVKFNLAVSLHAANDIKRNEIMPINESNSLKALEEAIKHYYDKTGNPITYEYIVFDGFNDEITDAHELYEFCQHVPCKVNVIEYNPIDDGKLQQAKPEKTDAFINYLEKRGVVVNVRRSRGKDIDAACGQLANKLDAKKQKA